MGNNEALNQALMGKMKAPQVEPTRPQLSSLRTLSKAAILGLLLNGCADSPEYDIKPTRDDLVKINNKEDVKHVGATWISDCYKDFYAFGVYPDDITVTLTDMGDPNNTVTVTLSVEDKLDGVSTVYSSFEYPVIGDVKIDAYHDDKKLPYCENKDQKDCITGPGVIPGP